MMVANPITGKESRLDSLARAWLEAKQAEDDARRERNSIESQLVEAACFAKQEGSQTVPIEGHSITFTAPVRRTVDPGAWEAVREEIPAKFWPIRYKPEVITSAWKDPALAPWRTKLAQCVSEKPGKIGVTVKVREDRSDHQPTMIDTITDREVEDAREEVSNG